MTDKVKDAWARSTTVEKPYAVFTTPSMPDWEWRVLKAYQRPDKERLNPYARWFCAVRSPMTWGSWEYGDTYISDIPGAVPGQR